MKVNIPVVNFSRCPHLDSFDAVTFTETVVKLTMESLTISCCSNDQTNFTRLSLSTDQLSWKLKSTTIHQCVHAYMNIWICMKEGKDMSMYSTCTDVLFMTRTVLMEDVLCTLCVSRCFKWSWPYTVHRTLEVSPRLAVHTGPSNTVKLTWAEAGWLN